MTYCIAMSLKQGLVLTSDSRTNSGIDSVSTYSKMHISPTAPDRTVVMMSAGNLATTQGVIDQVHRDIREQQPHNINSLGYISDIADYVGGILVNRIQKHSDSSGFVPDASIILAGQIQGGQSRAFMIYPQGNYITTSEETPYLQIGESKYGKPVLDRFIDIDTTLKDAAVCSLISMDSTMKSNAGVGPPIEVLLYQRDSFSTLQRYRFEAEDPYLQSIRQEWAAQLNHAFKAMPSLDMKSTL